VPRATIAASKDTYSPGNIPASTRRNEKTDFVNVTKMLWVREGLNSSTSAPGLVHHRTPVPPLRLKRSGGMTAFC
jgi:hypothetical protein